MFIPLNLTTDKWQAWGTTCFVTNILYGANLDIQKESDQKYVLKSNLYWNINPESFQDSWYSIPTTRLYRVQSDKETGFMDATDLYTRFKTNKALGWGVSFSTKHPSKWNGKKTADAGILSNSILAIPFLEVLHQANVLEEVDEKRGTQYAKDLFENMKKAYSGKKIHHKKLQSWFDSNPFKGALRKPIDDDLFQSHITIDKTKKY